MDDVWGLYNPVMAAYQRVYVTC